jgi:hypothetical protein
MQKKSADEAGHVLLNRAVINVFEDVSREAHVRHRPIVTDEIKREQQQQEDLEEESPHAFLE